MVWLHHSIHCSKKGSALLHYLVFQKQKEKKSHKSILGGSVTWEWDKSRITQICVKRDQKAHCSFLDPFTRRPHGFTMLTKNLSVKSLQTFLFSFYGLQAFRGMIWHKIKDIAGKSKGSGLQGCQISTRGCGDEQLVAACELFFPKTQGLYYHIPQPRLKKFTNYTKWLITANAAETGAKVSSGKTAPNTWFIVCMKFP